MTGNDDRLGERVTVSDISDAPIHGSLPHPQDPWRSASGIDQPFQGSAPKNSTRRVGADTNYDPRGDSLRDPLSEAQERRAAATTPAAPAPTPARPPAKGTRPVPVSSKVSRKETDTLRKFREVFGLQRIAVVDAIIKRADPSDPSKNVEMVFGLRGIGFEDYQWVLEKTQEMMQSPNLATFAWKIAFISMGVASMDKVPLWEVLGFVPEEMDHVRDPMYPHMGLRFQVAEAFCQELRTSLFDTVEHLYSAYEDKIDSTYLPKKEKPVETSKEEEEGSQGPLTQTGSGS